ncbi:MAG: hypothetical protein LC708_02630, partial [Actinobacteria bacterium]|nr:hypothetical protein [Actinomycetota bacterium]
MDDNAFRASVFAEQKQLSAFSTQPPHERKRLVLQLLGITPLDAARDNARRDARSAQSQYDRLRSMLPDLDALRRQVDESEQAAAAAEKAATEHEAQAVALSARREAATARAEELDVLRQEHEMLVAEARSVRIERDRSAATAARLTAELAELDLAVGRLETLAPEAEGWREAEAQLRLVEAVVAARAVVQASTVPPAPEPPDEEGTEAARLAAEAARTELAAVNGRREAALAELERARQTVARAADLTGEADCPLCGQSLGDAFADVQAHRATELGEAEARLAALDADRSRLAAEATDASRRATEGARALRDARTAWEIHQKAVTERERATQALVDAETALGRTATVEERTALAVDVDRRRRAADECLRLRGRLERRPQAANELDVERLLVAEHEGRLAAIEEKVSAVGFRADDLAEARAALHRARLDAEEAAAGAQTARLALAEARARAAGESKRLAEGTEQHARLEDLGEEARHLSRVGELLHGFRNTQVAAVGPRLSIQAADLFGELTDNEYDRLEVDPETYEIKVRDAGVLYGMSRFSGSETDLANLALRVAISEHVRFQSGGAVGLLVL